MPAVPPTPRRTPPPLPPARRPVRLAARAWVWRLRHLLAATCLALAAGAVVHALQPPPPVTVAAVVAARDVAAGATISSDDVRVEHVAPGTVPAGALSGAGAAVGATAAVDLPAGLPLVPSLLATGEATGPPGTVVTAVRLADAAVADLVGPGSRVDLLGARPEGGPGTTLATRALVLPAPAGGAAATGVLGSVDGSGDPPPLLVAVQPAEALALAEASASSRISAVVVP
ncbi:hypothetical protein GCM10023113_21340 [Cellulomonas oligotrophica]|uniref:SAF domain-containing protein n=1 Tax=Cellulomonas oligotrophica TaxID=931536 RepID=A0ABQ4DFK9_9CELL|nr:hypothetical protein Col01nite_36800 [Cellulomonas oligotrophica]